MSAGIGCTTVQQYSLSETLCWLLRISIGMPNFEMPNLDCISKEISIQSTIVPVRKSLVQWLTESRFGISKFGI